MAWQYGQYVWDYLMGVYQNIYGVSGIMGNMVSESGILPFRLQNDFSDGYTRSHQYTLEVNNGTISEYTFVHDEKGYGLTQWTYYTRKQELYDRTVKQGKLVNDIDVQLQLLVDEVARKPELLNAIVNATDFTGPTVAFMLIFENPKDKSETAQELRVLYAQSVYDEYYGTGPGPGPGPQPPIEGAWLYGVMAETVRRIMR